MFLLAQSTKHLRSQTDSLDFDAQNRSRHTILSTTRFKEGKDEVSQETITRLQDYLVCSHLRS